MILRNIIWKVSKDELQSLINVRRDLESLGYDNREMLIAARHKLGDEIDVKKRLKDVETEEGSEGMMEALYGESVFHNGGQIEKDGLQSEDGHVYFGGHPVDELEKSCRHVSKKPPKMACHRTGRKG